MLQLSGHALRKVDRKMSECWYIEIRKCSVEMTHIMQSYNKIEYCIFSLETYTLTETRKKVTLNYKRWTGNMK